ncbi:transcriptional regulatory protein STB4 [Penicillium angulare]|uniref:Transcriptional regulatory protein STB4 n=1 Tax=Penicillium angulare TaxID=116970 RepID=A0A9W9FZE0_9EURO|nr:transcriptional regulatory protein STB4 [Penicillium angulare]
MYLITTPLWKQFRLVQSRSHLNAKVAETIEALGFFALLRAGNDYGAFNMETDEGSGPYTHQTINRPRQKVTHACQSCRKRRVKCDGVAPCSNCSKQDITCNFDKTSRGRRGPRPRRNGIHLTSSKRLLKPRQPLNETNFDAPNAVTENLDASSGLSVALDVGQLEPSYNLAQDGFLPSYQQGPPLETWREFVLEATGRQNLAKKYSFAG